GRAQLGMTAPEGTLRIASAGHAVFAATLIGIGVLGLVKGDFIQLWLPVPKILPAREVLVYLCALVPLACGLGLFWQRTAATAARVLLVFVVLWTLAFKARFIILAPTQEGSYQTNGENAVVIAGAWVLYAWFAADWDRRHVGFATGERGVRIARVIYALAMIAFGLSHFAYLSLTAPLVPGWLPWHVGWAYFTGAAYIAAAVAMLTGIWPRLAALLSTLMMAGFTFLVWLPVAVPGTLSAFRWRDLLVSS